MFTLGPFSPHLDDETRWQQEEFKTVLLDSNQSPSSWEWGEFDLCQLAETSSCNKTITGMSSQGWKNPQLAKLYLIFHLYLGMLNFVSLGCVNHQVIV